MHLCTAIAGQIETLQTLQGRIAACVPGIANGKTNKANVAALQAEFIACKEALHKLRLHTPEYLRQALGIERGTEQKQWNHEVYMGGIRGPRWGKDAEGYMQMLDLTGCSSLTDITVLGKLTGLQTLYLGGCSSLTDITALGRLTGLRTLYISECSSVQDITALGKLTGLQTLDLGGCSSVQDITALGTLTGLQRLNLWGCTSLTDIGALSGLTGLQRLNLIGCSSIKDITALGTLTGLKELNLWGCSSLTPELITALRTVLPNCNINP
jgi:Leucine-rich repeat (LRR) protein